MREGPQKKVFRGSRKISASIILPEYFFDEGGNVMRFIFIGDVVGKGGRETVKQLVPDLRREYNAQFVIVNGENSAGGNGLTGSCLRELLHSCDVVTSGDHTWDQKGFDLEIDRFDRMIRPANYHACQPGKGYGIFDNPAGGKIAVVALQGKVFMKDSAACPFETADKILAELPAAVKTIVVDFHAEATSEKLALASYLDGRVTAVLGTHTHVQTADARVLPGGTAAITDAGMTGADASILGRAIPDVLKKFSSGMPCRLPVVENGTIRLDGVAVTYDHVSGRASAIESFSKRFEIQ